MYFLNILFGYFIFISEEDDENQNEMEDDEESVIDEEDSHHSTARPRRITEIPNEKVKQIPVATSLFIFSKTNK